MLQSSEILRPCEELRDEATQASSRTGLGCFASHAMTVKKGSCKIRTKSFHFVLARSFGFGVGLEWTPPRFTRDFNIVMQNRRKDRATPGSLPRSE